jgi:trk system potassium uptake protein TrkH
MELFGPHPGRMAIIYFAIGIIIGAVVLTLPVSSAGKPISFIDSLFTATSAVCVTGLTVLDTGHDYSTFGQVVILILIQLGGLGIMTFATTLMLMMGAKLSFAQRLGLSESYSTGSPASVRNLLLAIIITTFSTELLGAVALFFKFNGQFPAGHAAFLAVFHAVSAFCNAGFSPFTNSLENYQGDGVIIIVFSMLIICGGLGFAVIADLFNRIRYKSPTFSLHTKICLMTTAILLILGTAAIFVAEHDNAFKNVGILQSIGDSFFQSVTARTAGFNTLPQRGLTEVSLLVTMLLMFIGACPGSTGGGIKTTTFAVIMLLVYNRFRGRQSVAAFRRSISADSINRALTVALLAALVMILMIGLLMFAEERPLAHQLSQGWFVDSLFEVVSAFGTVGLSLGMTSHLHTFGKIILIVTMFVGRVGLLTLAFSLARPMVRGEVVYSEEPVLVG